MQKRPWLAAVLNFFFMGPGYIYNGRKALIGLGLTLGAMVLTYVELQIQQIDTLLYGLMFAAVFLVNTCLAIDGFREAKAINAGAR